MNGFLAYRTSRVAPWVKQSAVARFFCRDMPGEPRTLAHTQVLRPLSVVGPLVLPLALLALIGSLALGNFYGAAMVGMFLFAYGNPTLALGATPTLLLWAPRLPVFVIGDEALFLRLDHAALAGMLLALITDSKGALRTPPAHTMFLFFLATLPLSIIAGTLQGTLHTPTSALLYLAQWLTWWALFVVAFSLAPRLRPYTVYAWAVPLIAFAAYGLAESVWPYFEEPHVRYRTFERGLFPGQANHAGGLLALATVTGLALACQSKHRVLGLALAALSTAALLPTGSRSGVLAWAAGIVMLALIYCPPLRWWGPPLALLGLVAIPGSLWYRFSAPGSSMYDRLVAWKSALSTVGDYPLLGLGAGARHRSYYDNQYLMALAESGLLGLLALLIFLAILVRAFRQQGIDNPAVAWMATGAMAGMVVLAVHSMATASFVVTLVAGPFFWYSGVTLGTRDERP